MQAYEAGLKANDTRLVLRPDSDFFRFFGAPGGKAAEPKAEAGSQANSEPKSKAQSEPKAQAKVEP